MSAGSQAEPTEEEAQARLRALIGGYRVSQALYVATRLGIPDLLADGPRYVDTMTQQLGLPVSELTRTLMMLEMKKVVRRLPGNQYERR